MCVQAHIYACECGCVHVCARMCVWLRQNSNKLQFPARSKEQLSVTRDKIFKSCTSVYRLEQEKSQCDPLEGNTLPMVDHI